MDLKKDVAVLDEAREKELEAFRLHLGIADKDRFDRAVEFVEKVIEGATKVQAYANAFNVPLQKARTVASQFHKSKWVQEIFIYLRPDDQSLYFGEVKRIIQVGMEIIDSNESSPRDKIEAMKALQPYVKAEKLAVEFQAKKETVGETTTERIKNMIAEISSEGRMINEKGEIIDVDVVM